MYILFASKQFTRVFGVDKYMIFDCFRELTANHLTIDALQFCIPIRKLEQNMNLEKFAIWLRL